MTSKHLGLIRKYRVERLDGQPVDWCFVLEEKDPLAWPAILTYADMAEGAGYLQLAADLRAKATGVAPPPDEATKAPDTIFCHRPHSNCPPIDAWGQFVVLDVPDESQHWFCNLSCLWAWMQHRVTDRPPAEPPTPDRQRPWTDAQRPFPHSPHELH